MKYWTIFFDTFQIAEEFMSDKESELYEKGVIPKKEELKSLKNGDWYWQVCFNKPVYETEMKNLCRDRDKIQTDEFQNPYCTSQPKQWHLGIFHHIIIFSYQLYQIYLRL